MFECEVCIKQFNSYRAASQHMNALDHWGLECPECDLITPSEEYLNQHIRSQHQGPYCADCDRHFQNDNNLRQHLRSKIHQGSNISCPFCKRSFTTASGLSHHLETGSCNAAPGLNRERIHQQCRLRDPHGFITEKLLEWHPESASRQSWDPQEAWNGYAWECYICHRDFQSKAALTSHVNSPAHEQKLYHCPNRQCPRQFVSLAGFLNHLESESCGYVKFEAVQRHVGQLFNPQTRSIGFA